MRTTPLLSGFLILAAAACAPAHQSGAPAHDATAPSSGAHRYPAGTPDHFLVGEIDGSATSQPAAGTGCKSPMVDPRNGLKLTLVRSSEGQGDYDVPSGKYGVAADEVLRIDCATGRAVGIVKRPSR